jgi:hypothetical protein
VALALDAALAGILETRAGVLRLLSYAHDPLVWGAMSLQATAEAFVWTPALVFDYARALQRLTQPQVALRAH